jgi:hypothetical protein
VDGGAEAGSGPQPRVRRVAMVEVGPSATNELEEGGFRTFLLAGQKQPALRAAYRQHKDASTSPNPTPKI